MAEKPKVTEMVLILHCNECYKKVKKLLSKFSEIRDQAYDEEKNEVTIKVVGCCPEKVRDKLRCKGRCCIKSIDIVKPPPPPPPPPDPKPDPKPPPPPPPVCLTVTLSCCTICCKGGCKGPCYNPCNCYGRPPAIPCGGKCGRSVCDGCCGQPPVRNCGGNCGRSVCDGCCGQPPVRNCGGNCGKSVCDGCCGGGVGCGGDCGHPCSDRCGGLGGGGYCEQPWSYSYCDSSNCTIT